MNFLALRYFLMVSEMLNFTKAAEKLHISQQALSNHVRNLEERLGVTLFHRGKQISLTYAGMRLVHYATEIMGLERQMHAEMHNIAHRERGVLRIAANPTRSAALLPEVLSKFYEEYPYVEIISSEATPRQVEELLVASETDIVIGLKPHYQKVVMEELYREMVVGIVPKAYIHTIFGLRADQMLMRLTEAFDPRIFMRMPTIMLAKGMQIRAWVDEYFGDCGMYPDIFHESSGVQTMLSMAVKGLGVAYSTETFLYSIKDELQRPDCSVAVFPIRETKGKYPLGVFYRKDMQLGNAAKRFIELVKDYYGATEFVYDGGSIRFVRKLMDG